MAAAEIGGQIADAQPALRIARERRKQRSDRPRLAEPAAKSPVLSELFGWTEIGAIRKDSKHLLIHGRGIRLQRDRLARGTKRVVMQTPIIVGDRQDGAESILGQEAAQTSVGGAPL